MSTMILAVVVIPAVAALGVLIDYLIDGHL